MAVTPKWFLKMSTTAKKQYLKDHPNSILHKNANAKLHVLKPKTLWKKRNEFDKLAGDFYEKMMDVRLNHGDPKKAKKERDLRNMDVKFKKKFGRYMPKNLVSDEPVSQKDFLIPLKGHDFLR